MTGVRRPIPAEERLARVALRDALGVRRHDPVTVATWPHSLPYARAFVHEARAIGADPVLVLEDEETFFRGLAERPARLPGPAPRSIARGGGAYVYFPGPEAFHRLLGLPADELLAIVGRHDAGWHALARRSGLRGLTVGLGAVTPTAAGRFGIDVDAWEREVLAASLRTPTELARRAAPWERALAHARTVRIRHANGTDLTVRLRGARPRREDGAPDPSRGRLWASLPAGLVSVALPAGGADGTWESNRPVYDRLADPPVAEGARFEFEGGRLREFSFDRGGAAFGAAYAAGGAGRAAVSGLTLGLNPEVDRAPEFGEYAAGRVGLVLGDNRAVGGRHRSRFSYLTLLHGADLEIDGVRRLAAGRTRP